MASRARRLHDESSCLKLTVGWFGSQVPSTEGLTLCLFLLGRSRCWGWVAAVGFSRGHALLSLRQSQARGEKSIIHCWKGHLQLERLSFHVLWPSHLQHLLWFGGEVGTKLRGGVVTVPWGVPRISKDLDFLVGASFPHRFDKHRRRPLVSQSLSQIAPYSLHSALQKLWAESFTKIVVFNPLWV